MLGVSILGSTGSIGNSTLEVISLHPEKYRVIALSAYSDIEQLFVQITKYSPQVAVVVDEAKALQLKKQVKAANLRTEILAGNDSLNIIASHPSAEVVMAAIVGSVGLMPTLAAVEAGKRVLLANKESLVMGGKFFIDKVHTHNAELLPIDSEHNAIFQCLPNDYQKDSSLCLSQLGVEEILLTGSGGPFLNLSPDKLSNVSPEQACNHPNWSMGRKISVDSATMMNKGLEFIEAHWLFNLPVASIKVVIHPQSIVHSMVRYEDGSVIAQMGNPDMKTPIAHAMAFPSRLCAGVAPLDFAQICDFSFQSPDFEQFPNLKLAIDSCKDGQAATTVLNAANEISVAAFLANKIRFTDIYKINETISSRRESISADNLEDILALDQLTRRKTTELLETFH